MINNCKDCQVKCCSAGPGPYKTVDPEVWLLNFGEHNMYNKKCSEFINGKCNLWGSPRMPLECRVYVCSSRSFSIDELKEISNLTGRN